MRRSFSLLLLLLVVCAAGSAVAPSAAAAGQRSPTRKVLLVTMPATRWEDIEALHLPVLDGLIARSAVASMSVRTIGPYTSLGEGYGSLGAGNRMAVIEEDAALALPNTAPFEGDTADDVFQRRCGCSSNGAAVLQLGMPRLTRRNADLLYGTVPGSLGQALADAGRTAAVVGNADESLSGDLPTINRQVALAAVDESGRVPVGNVSHDILMKDPAAPFGVRDDPVKKVDAARQAWRAADFLVFEMSDLYRVEAYRVEASDLAIEQARNAALERADAMLGELLKLVDLDRDRVIVVGPTSPLGPAQLTVWAMAGHGVEPGWARSPTTRRAGYVTMPDVGPTVLDSFGIAVPNPMNGTAVRSVGGFRPDAGTVTGLADRNTLTVFRDRATAPVSVLFIVFQILVYFVAAYSLRRFPAARRWLAPLTLITLAQPSIAFASAFFRYDRLGLPGYLTAFFGLGALLAWLALEAGRRLGPKLGTAATLVPPLLLIGLTEVVLLIDVVIGAPMQLDTVFGYSPTVAGRFSGYGNLAFGLLAAATMILASGAWGGRVLRGKAAPTAAVAAFLALVVILDGMPSWGSDVGGVLALVPASGVLVLLLGGKRVNWLRLVLLGAATVVVIGSFALVDLARPPESRTHLGRLAAKLFGQEGGGAGQVILRKLNANINILTSSVWTWVIPAAVLFLSFLLWRGTGPLQRLERRLPGLRAGLVAALVAGGLGFALNDSGVAVPAVMLAVVLPYVTFLVLATAEDP